MQILITSKKPVLTQMGRLAKDTVADVPHSLAMFLIDRGDAVAYETKAPVAIPAPAELEQAIDEAIAEPKKRGRRPKGE